MDSYLKSLSHYKRKILYLATNYSTFFFGILMTLITVNYYWLLIVRGNNIDLIDSKTKKTISVQIIFAIKS